MLIITIREYGLLRLMNHGRVGADQLDFSLVHDLFDLFFLSMRIPDLRVFILLCFAYSFLSSRFVATMDGLGRFSCFLASR